MPLGVYEIWIHGCASIEETLALQEPIARVLCPDELHDSPCEVPWGFSLSEDEPPVLVLGIYATADRAAEITGRVDAVAGNTRRAELRAARPGVFTELAEQYEIERMS